MITEHVLAPETGIAITIATGDRLRVIDLEGGQVVDMVVFNAANPREKLSLPYSRSRYRPQEGQTFYPGDKLLKGDVLRSTIYRAMMRIVSTGQAQFGIYADAPQPAVPVLEDIRLLSRTARDAIVGGHSIDASPLGRELIGLFEMSEDWTRAIRARPDSAVGAAVGTTLGHRALTNPAAIISLLQGRLAHSTSYTAHTPQLQTLIAAALGRRRRPIRYEIDYRCPAGSS